MTTPREKFRFNKTLTRGYNDLIYGNQMQSALDTAALEMDLKLTIAADVTTAAANRWRKEGADLYRRTLENLNSDTPQPKHQDTSQLDHHI